MRITCWRIDNCFDQAIDSARAPSKELKATQHGHIKGIVLHVERFCSYLEEACC